jgi:hypothetical protein
MVSMPTPARPTYIRAVGIDPGSITGMIALAVPIDGPHPLDFNHARLIGTAKIDVGDVRGAAARAGLFSRVRSQLAAWRPSLVVLEEPFDALPTWGKGKRTGGAARGTIFALGAHFGLCVAAAHDVGTIVHDLDRPHIAAYAVTSAREKTTHTTRGDRHKAERIGWMQRRESRIPSREHVLAVHRQIFRELQHRPHNGVLPTAAALRAVLDENITMALGVLLFHFDRERGAV